MIGTIGCLILLVTVDAATTHGTSKNASFYYVVAFLVGYREETFRTLIKRATDVLLSPGSASGASSQHRD